MSIETKKIGFTIEIDTEAIAPASVEVFIYQLLTRLNYEHTIKSVTVDDVTVPITDAQQMYDLSLGEDKPLKA